MRGDWLADIPSFAGASSFGASFLCLKLVADGGCSTKNILQVVTVSKFHDSKSRFFGKALSCEKRTKADTNTNNKSTIFKKQKSAVVHRSTA